MDLPLHSFGDEIWLNEAEAMLKISPWDPLVQYGPEVEILITAMGANIGREKLRKLRANREKAQAYRRFWDEWLVIRGLDPNIVDHIIEEEPGTPAHDELYRRYVAVAKLAIVERLRVIASSATRVDRS